MEFRKINNQLLWEGKPSQWINVGWGLFALLSPWLFYIPLILLGWHMLVTYCWNYKIFDDVLIEKKGVFTTVEDEVRMFRIKDIRVHRPFLMRLVGLTNIILITSDKFRPRFKITAVPYGKEIRETISALNQSNRRKHGVRELDIR